MFRTVLLTILFVVVASVALAEEKATPGIPPTMSYQGLLTDLAGDPISDGFHSLTVRIYNDIVGGDRLWEETLNVQVVNGVFSAILGQILPLTIVDFNQFLWLGLEVDAEGESSPRIFLTSTPYSFIAGDLADGVAVRSLNGLVDEVNLIAGSGMTVTPSGQNIILSSTGGGGGSDSDWMINGSDMYAIPTGNVGIGTTTPTANLHVVDSGVNGVGVIIEDTTDPAQQVFQLANLWLKTAQGIGLIAMTTTSGQKNMQIFSNTMGVNMHVRSKGEIRLDYIDRWRIWRNGNDVAEFTDQDEFVMFADPDGEDIGLILRGQDPGSADNGGEILLYNESGFPTVLIDGLLNPNLGGSIELKGQGNLPGVAIHGQRGPGNTGGLIRLFDSEGDQTVRIVGDNPGTSGSRGGMITMYADNGGERVRLSAQELGSSTQGGVLKLYNDAGTLTIELDADYGSTNEGRVITDVLQITGGSDLSEQFDISGLDAVIAPGHVVCIDPDHPGELKLSDRAYDTCVAGVISGAGGVRPGMVMGQRGSVADGDYPVALTGRVYVRVDASTGSIRPGDLLTTSDVPGYAMKVSDSLKSQGAVLGKAMTSLESGQGLVLVLVTLQ